MTSRQPPRRPARGELGFTVTELSMGIGLLAVILALLAPTYLALNDSAVRTQAQSSADQALRPVLVELSRQVGSAVVLDDPVNNSTSWANSGTTTPGFALLMYTGGNKGSVNGSCVQWQAVTVPHGRGDLLQMRSWAPASSSAVPFVTQALGAVLMNTSSHPPFSLSSSPGTDSVLSLDFFVSSGTRSPTVEIETQVAAQGLNVSGYSPTSICNSPPAQ